MRSLRPCFRRPALGGLLVLSITAGCRATASPSTENPGTPTAHAPGNHHAHTAADPGVERRGDQAMGFEHGRTTHRFRLFASGGAIEVWPNQPDDTESRDRIRSHLAGIAAAFAKGDFEAPMFIHDRVPPGVPTMKRLGNAITYTYEETAAGGKVTIETRNPDAVAAVHEFLRFQIEDHGTGDPLQVEAGP